MTAINERSSAAELDAAREIRVTRTFDAPRELVFAMWTNPEHVMHWWGPRGFTNTIDEMDVRPGGVWRFVMHGPDGRDYLNKIVFREVVRPQLLTYSHVTGPFFDVTVTFTERGAQTEVAVRMVFVSAEERDRVAMQFGAVEGLEQTLERLGEQLAHVEAFTISRVFDAPRDLVWRAWTERDHLVRWWGPRGMDVTHCTNDLRPGGMMLYRISSEERGELWGRWIYREISSPRKLVFVTSFSDAQGGVTTAPFFDHWPREILTTIVFDEEAGGTRVTLQWSPIHATEEERAMFAQQHESLRGGWSGTYDKLGAYLTEKTDA